MYNIIINNILKFMRYFNVTAIIILILDTLFIRIFENKILNPKVKFNPNHRSSWRIHKSNFKYYYLLALVVNSICIYLTYNYINLDSLVLDPYPSKSTNFGVKILPFLLQIQAMRRLYEGLYVHIYSKNASMPIINLILGLIYYLGLSILLNQNALLNYKWDPNFWNTFYPSISLYIGLILFFYASYKQFCIHRYLASLRQIPGSTISYNLPKSSDFKNCSSPHYYYEVLIYISFLIIDRLNSLDLVIYAALVVTNLTISAKMTHVWYLINMPKLKSIIERRHPIFPFLAN